jgi:hypothetical protein
MRPLLRPVSASLRQSTPRHGGSANLSALRHSVALSLPHAIIFHVASYYSGDTRINRGFRSRPMTNVSSRIPWQIGE